MSIPSWLYHRMLQHGGNVPFHQYMNWALHDPENGVYGSGLLQIGSNGDFVTSPSLGPVFAHLLTFQLEQWFKALGQGPLALIEIGPGEGHLALQLAKRLFEQSPGLKNRLEIILIEPNNGMNQRQITYLAKVPLPLRWSSLEELSQSPVKGLIIAHEVLDALAVERIVLYQEEWYRQRVALLPSKRDKSESQIILIRGERWERDTPRLESLGLYSTQNLQRANGWSTELHTEVLPSLRLWNKIINKGYLLIIDYLIEKLNYYMLERNRGTIMTYSKQLAGTDPLIDPGMLDITAHVCTEIVLAAAANTQWSLIGQVRQGEALLALGLAQQLYYSQSEHDKNITNAINNRENILRLVDPTGLGNFYWIAFNYRTIPCRPLFLNEP